MPVRKNAFSLTPAEQDVYKNGITALIADGTYQKLVNIHADMSHKMHDMGEPDRIGAWRFLSWHRAYLLKLEAELVKKDATAFIPYWKWVDGGVPGWLTSFKPTVGAVNNARTNITTAITDQARIDLLVAKTDYFDFSHSLELDPHNKGHRALGPPMANVPTAPSDPIFWMHHGEVDRVWSLWQAKNPGKGPVLTGQGAVMDPWSDSVTSLSSITKLNYSYA